MKAGDAKVVEGMDSLNCSRRRVKILKIINRSRLYVNYWLTNFNSEIVTQLIYRSKMNITVV